MDHERDRRASIGSEKCSRTRFLCLWCSADVSHFNRWQIVVQAGSGEVWKIAREDRTPESKTRRHRIQGCGFGSWALCNPGHRWHGHERRELLRGCQLDGNKSHSLHCIAMPRRSSAVCGGYCGVKANLYPTAANLLACCLPFRWYH